MNRFELNEFLRQLEVGLNQAGLDALTEQERVAAQEGRTDLFTAREIADFESQGGRRVKDRPRLKVGDVRVRPLDVRERIQVLLDLVEAAVGGTYSIEFGLRDQLETSITDLPGSWNGTVVFDPPREEDQDIAADPTWTLPTTSELANRRSQVERVLQLLHTLREHVEVDRAKWLDVPADEVGQNQSRVDLIGEWE
jgi:hypothetical protein